MYERVRERAFPQGMYTYVYVYIHVCVCVCVCVCVVRERDGAHTPLHDGAWIIGDVLGIHICVYIHMYIAVIHCNDPLNDALGQDLHLVHVYCAWVFKDPLTRCPYQCSSDS